ncbi:MAG TPA: DUF3298 domain-containing protein [Pyrinomonadaceae bacterium]|nr:DUF3298 domain-containing protein [Pyrinomonadaceae bacterium]
MRFCTGCGASLTGATPPQTTPSSATPNQPASHQPPYNSAPYPPPTASTAAPSSPWKKILVAVACLVALGVLVGLAVRQFSRGGASRVASTSGQSSGGASTPTPTPSLDFDKVFAGTVGGDFKVELRLRREGESLSGSFFHWPAREEPGRAFSNDGDGTPVWGGRKDAASRVDALVRGAIEAGDAFTLEELGDEGRAVGVFKGRLAEGASALEGTWTKPDGKGQQPFSLREVAGRRGADSYRLVAKRTRRKTKALEINLAYPSMEGATPAAQTFNARVQRLVNEQLAESKPSEGEHDTSFVVAHRSPDFLSVVFNAFQMWPGAAHPGHASYSFNYDLKNDREVKLADLFRPGSNYMSTVARLCADDIARQKRRLGFEDIYEDQQGAVAEVLSGDATFFPSESGLVIIFDPYEVGSYAEGYYVVRLPYSSLRGLLRADGYVGTLAE